jgi:hypothetical protein
MNNWKPPQIKHFQRHRRDTTVIVHCNGGTALSMSRDCAAVTSPSSHSQPSGSHHYAPSATANHSSVITMASFKKKMYGHKKILLEQFCCLDASSF